MTTTSETLFRAAELIEKQGWVRGWMGWTIADRPDQKLCLEGGILAALGMDAIVKGCSTDEFVMASMRECPAYRAVKEHLALANDIELCGWNDYVAKDRDEVLNVLRTVAEKERIKENELVDQR